MRCQGICLSFSLSTFCHLPPAEISKYPDKIVQLRSASLMREGECVQLTIFLFLSFSCSEITRELKNQANPLSSVTLDLFPTQRDDREYMGWMMTFVVVDRQWKVKLTVKGREKRFQLTVATRAMLPVVAC